MSVIRERNIPTMLRDIRSYIYNRQMYNFNEETGEFITDPHTGKIIRTGKSREESIRIAKKRYNEINNAIDNLPSASYNSYTTKSGKVVYYTLPKFTVNAYILFTKTHTHGQVVFSVFAVYIKGKPIDRVLASLESRIHSTHRYILYCYESHRRVQLRLRETLMRHDYRLCECRNG